MNMVSRAATLALVLAVSGLGFGQAKLGVVYKKLSKQREGYWSAVSTVPQFSGMTPLAKFANQVLENYATSGFDEFAKAVQANMGNRKPQAPFQHLGKPYVSVARPDLISVYFDRSEYTGGAHPNRYFGAFTFALVGGKPRTLQLADLFRKDVDPLAVTSALVIPILREKKAAWVVDGTMKALDANQANNFVVTPTALTFLFEPYSAGAYAQGPFVAKVPFSEFGDSLDESGPLAPLMKSMGTKPAPVTKPPVASASELVGTATYRERIALPPGTELVVRLVDSLGGIVSEATFKGVSGPPFSFRMPIPKDKLDPDLLYQIQVRLRAEGKTWFREPADQYVLTQGHPSKVDLVLVRSE